MNVSRFSRYFRLVHGWLLIYPASEHSFYDAVIQEMHCSYRYGGPALQVCGAAVQSELTRVHSRRPSPKQ